MNLPIFRRESRRNGVKKKQQIQNAGNLSRMQGQSTEFRLIREQTVSHSDNSVTQETESIRNSCLDISASNRRDVFLCATESSLQGTAT